jgi:hypothetical protein
MQMFENYSEQALKVLFIARLKAGELGAEALDLKHLLSALIIENQGGELAKPLLGIKISEHYATGPHSFATRAHLPFFAKNVAEDLLRKLETGTSSKKVPPSVDLCISAQLQRVLAKADALKAEFPKQDRIDPLHLLAAALADHSDEAVKMFEDSGVTYDVVCTVIRGKHR